MTPPHPLPIAKGPLMHPADRLALAALALFAAGVTALAPLVWHAFEGRGLNAVFAVVAAMCFTGLGWMACRWDSLAEGDVAP
jgi:hypothetical protein